MNDVIGISVCLCSTVLTYLSHRWMERGARENYSTLKVLGSCTNIVAGILVGVSLSFSDETLVAVLGSFIVPLTYIHEKWSRKWIWVACVVLGAVLVIVRKAPSKTPNPLSDRLIWCILFGSITTTIMFNVQPRPMFAGLFASLTETMAKALMSTAYVSHQRDPMIGAYAFAMLSFGALQLVYLGECYKWKTQLQIIPEFIVSIMVLDTVLAGWVFHEWTDETHWTFWLGLSLSSVAAAVLSQR